MAPAPYTRIENHIYFFGAKVKITRFDDGTFGVQNAAYTQYLPPYDTAGKWLDLCQQGTIESASTTRRMYIGAVPVDGLEIIGKEPDLTAYADCFNYIDLTDLFGSGNEPSLDDMVLAYDIYWCLQKGEPYYTEHLVKEFNKTPEYSDTESFDRFLAAMKWRATELRMDDSVFNSPSGFPSFRGNNLMTAFDLLKLGIAACSNETALRHMSVGRHTFEGWGDSILRSVETAGIVNRQYDDDGPVVTNTILAGKGGSLNPPASGQDDNAQIHNYFAITCLRPYQSDVSPLNNLGETIAVSMMGLVEGESFYNYLVDIQSILNLLANKAEPVITDRLQAAISRETNPIEVAACILPSGNFGAYQYMDKAAFERCMITWFSTDTFHQKVPASTTKMLTLLLACENMDSPNEIVTIKNFDLVGGSGGLIHAGDQITLDELMYSMMVISDNQAATAIARHIGNKMLKNRLQ